MPGASSTDAFWRLLREGASAITDLPPDRRDLDRLSEADRSLPGILRGGFLDRIGDFDAGFFGIGPGEAAAMDPQQRLMLELGWEALEDAGIVPNGLIGSQTGVFVGAIADDYAHLLERYGTAAITRHALTGTQRGIIANRLSHTLGLRGPSLTVDTAQSSALTAVHLACESLRRGESGLALAGGVNLNIGLTRAVAASRVGVLSADGLCFTFDARANGYVRGEGGGVVVLKPLSRALADGDAIHSVIRGSAINNDGASDGLAAPDRQAQEEVLRLACRRAGIKRANVQYVELHGSATRLGDQAEAAALGAVLGAGRAAGDPLLVGSAKTNVGHLEGAAGIAGLIKAILCIKHREIPPSLNFQEPGPQLPLEELHLCVQRALGQWPDLDRPLLAGVSSFGIGGTNCHVVLSESPSLGGDRRGRGEDSLGRGGGRREIGDGPRESGYAILDAPDRGLLPWVVSARSEPALREQAQHLLAHVEDRPELDNGEVGCSLAVSRTSFEHRAVVLGKDRKMLLEGLGTLARGGSAVNVVGGAVGGGGGVADVGGGVVFVFPGQGGQWVGMALGLLDSSPVFGEWMRLCGVALEPFVDWSVEGVLRGVGGAPGLDRVDVVQPVLFCVMVSLAGLWRACGVEPGVVVGHSQGEIAAAVVAGGLSLEDGARLVVLRSRALVGLVGGGGMVSVGLSVGEVEGWLEGWGGVSVAAVNGPSSVVVSGERGALDGLLAEFVAGGVRAREIPVGYASHSVGIEGIREELLEGCVGISPVSGGVPFCSSVTGGLVDMAGLDGEYWFRNLRETVRFEGAVRWLLGEGYRVFVEVSPHPVLTVGVQETVDVVLGGGVLEGRGGVVVAGSLRRGQGGLERFLLSLGEVWVRGVNVDWGAVFAGRGVHRRVKLPTYAFQRRHCWLAPPPGLELDAGDVSRGGVNEPRAEFGRVAPDESLPDESLPDGSFARRLAGAPESERDRAVLDLVCVQVAIILGHDSPASVPTKRAFKDLGFDSPAAVELRNRLRAATGLSLPSALLFDYPTPAALAGYLSGEIAGGVRARTAVAAPAPSVTEPIAIVGMSCRYPQSVRSAEQLWEMVAHGGDAISGFPTDRGWDLEGLYDRDPDHTKGSYVREGGFLDDAGEFDAGFFGISPREALAMDPQQRLLLEVSWEACEDAGIDPHALRGGQVGVFVGAMAQDYGPRLHEAVTDLEGYTLTGNTASVVSGRLSYTFGFEGPAVTVDTACSASLVALHLACQALRQGECSLALTGGVAVMANPGMFVEFSRQRGLAPDGRCKSFASAADGTAWGEGVGVLLVERLSDARRLGHEVLALVRGSAINQDGASNGLTAPNGPSQQRVIAQALANAGCSADEVDVVEAHGTGTRLGDPIEAQALLATYGQGRPAESPLWLGSVKSNIGHTQAAAGVAGVIKMVMAMRHDVLPRTLHVDEPSREVDWSAGEVSLLTEAVPWTRGERPRRAGVSSFGISGTNAHVIIEEPPAPDGVRLPPRVPACAGRGALDDVVPWIVSGRSAGALQAQAERLQASVESDAGIRLHDVAYALADRSAFEHRAVVLGKDRKMLLEGLGTLARGGSAVNVVGGAVGGGGGVADVGGGVVFVFPGQGGQWVGMALGLLDSSPVFGEWMRLCGVALEPFVDWSVEGVLRGVGGAPGLDRVDVVQPVLFCVMVSLAGLWRACGVEPGVVVGHSQGEIAAAVVAGGLSLEDGARLVVLRSRALVGLVGGGGMVSVGLSVGEVEGWLEGWGGVSVAAVNGPSSVVVSGERGALDGLLAEFVAGGVRAREIPVGYASHSVGIEGIREELLEGCVGISPVSGGVPFCSSVTGGLVDMAGLDGEYWFRNLRETVRFEGAVRWLLGEGYRVFVEVSPHPVLTVGVQETVDVVLGGGVLEGRGGVVVAGSLRRGQGGLERFLLSLGEVWVRGVDVDWGAVFAGRGVHRRVKLPTYAFQRERYWLERPIGRGEHGFGWSGGGGSSAARRRGGLGRWPGVVVHRPPVALVSSLARRSRGAGCGPAARHGVVGAGAARWPPSRLRSGAGADARSAAGAAFA